MSKKTLEEKVLKFKTWTEMQHQVVKEAERLSEDFFNSQITQLIEMYIEGSEEDELLERVSSIFDENEVQERVTDRLTFLLSCEEVKNLRVEHSSELQAQKEWEEEKEQILESASRLPNGNFYWDFSDLDHSWDFKLKLQELKARGKLVGGGRDGFYTDQPSQGLIRFTVVKFA